MKNNIKLIASDLDGTLFDKDKKITPELFEALLAASRRGVLLVPATGRPLKAIPGNVFKLPGVKYIISSNGAAVNSLDDGNDVIRFCLQSQTARKIIEASLEANAMLELFSGGRAYTEKRFLEGLEFSFNPDHAAYLAATRTSFENPLEFWEENPNSIENINLIFKETCLRDEFKNSLKGLEGVAVTSSSPLNVEITDERATKGGALKALCERLGIGRENVMAFGDSANDEDMLRFAGFGVAMDNGEEHIKNAACFVTRSCSENGVAAALKRFGLA